MTGWLVSVDREVSGGLASIQDLYAAWHADPTDACEAVRTKLALGSKIMPSTVAQISEPIFKGLRLQPGQAIRLVGDGW